MVSWQPEVSYVEESLWYPVDDLHARTVVDYEYESKIIITERLEVNCWFLVKQAGRDWNKNCNDWLNSRQSLTSFQNTYETSNLVNPLLLGNIANPIKEFR